ncbi:WD40 repeat domain-containing protein [Streptomyces sp. DSM 116496]|uniref:WD40 repeat domain-containing protein n=1 Tax=Streptomyces stoeckheimensis TaxID=3344656 RepID=UPI0038B2B197
MPPLTGQAVGAPLYSVVFSPDGTLLADGGRNDGIQLWDPATGQPVGRPFTDSYSCHALAFSPDGTLLASGSYRGTLRLWDPATSRPVGAPLTGHRDGVMTVAFSPDGTLLASGSSHGAVWLYKQQQLGGPPPN